ncbi:hypothetical protein B0T16DRAFT_188902 [Cercophora newfieldiana]|uniref:Uncharacterized protein n=1 Tax=Cercophora newfieldiana TaxID=92897 RepID=A0AA39Y117_9PEZI|nr:hypothetical protein B0T16DRAFT_188902 [Cercophora newfieldiana]
MAATRPIVFITGANTGIGLEAVKAFLASTSPYHIIVGSRSVEKGEQAIQQLKSEFPDSVTTLELVQVDLGSDDSINAAFQAVSSRHDHIDALVNNAGAMFDHWLGKKENTLRETINLAVDINVAGTHVLTHTFVPLLLKSTQVPRLLFLTSGLSSLAGSEQAFFPPMHRVELQPGWPKEGFDLPVGYRCSKAALNMLMLGWKFTLEGDGVKTWCISPGFLATGLGGNVETLKKMGAGDPSLGGIFIKDVVDGKRDADHGKTIRSSGVQPW